LRQRSFGSTATKLHGAGGKPPDERRCLRFNKLDFRRIRLTVDTDGMSSPG
jgi:hypothetical protein